MKDICLCVHKYLRLEIKRLIEQKITYPCTPSELLQTWANPDCEYCNGTGYMRIKESDKED